MSETILSLNDLYSYTGEKIINWKGHKNISVLSEIAAYSGYFAVQSQVKPSKLFTNASNVYIDSYNMLYKGDEIVTIIIPGLRDKFKAKKELLVSERNLFLDMLDCEIPTFKNIFEYKSLEDEEGEIPLFQLIGDITPYDIISIELSQLIETINKKNPLIFLIESINLKIQIDYSESDFYDFESKYLIKEVKFI